MNVSVADEGHLQNDFPLAQHGAPSDDPCAESRQVDRHMTMLG